MALYNLFNQTNGGASTGARKSFGNVMQPTATSPQPIQTTGSMPGWDTIDWMTQGQGDMAGSSSVNYGQFGDTIADLLGSTAIPGYSGAGIGGGSGDMSFAGASPEMIDFLRNNGYNLRSRYLSGDSAGGLQEVGLFGSDGNVLGQTKQYKVPSASGDLGAMAAIAAMYAGAGALNAGGAPAAGAGAGAGSVGGTGLSVSPGSGLSLGSAGASGAGLSATGGSGLTLAGATGTGTGLAAGTGSGLIGSGIGGGVLAGTGSMISPSLGGSGGLGSITSGAGAGGAGGAAGSAGSGLGTLQNILKGGGALQSLLTGGGTGGTSNLSNLLSLFSNQQQNNDLEGVVDKLMGMYGQDSPYAKNLRDTLQRKDAAAGRASQYGPREVELQAKLAENMSRNLMALPAIYGQQQGALNGMLGAGGRLFEGMGGMQSLLDLFKNLPDFGLGTNPEFNPADDGWWTDPYQGP